MQEHQNDQDQLPPHDEKAEGLLLACAVHRPAILSSLDPDLFYLNTSRMILERMKLIRAEHRPSVDVPDQFEHDIWLVLPPDVFSALHAALNDLPSAAGWSYWMGIVAEHAQARKLMQMDVDLKSAAAQLATGDRSAIEGIARSLAEISRLGAQSTETVSNMRSLDEESCARLETAWERGNVLMGIPTGFTKLNASTNGLLPTKFYVVAGRPGRGKSAFIAQIAHHAAASGISTLLISLEMTGSEIYDRLISIISRVNLRKFQDQTATDEDFEHVAAARAALRSIPLQITHRALRLGDILAASEKAASEGVKLIVVDYLQKISMPISRDNRSTVIGVITGAFKELAMRHEITVLSAAQINRDAEKEERPPILADLRESGSIEQDADWVAFLHETQNNITDLYIRKNRSGPEGRIPFVFNKPIFRFDEI